MPESCIVVAEVGQAHDGSLGTAHAYIDAVADAGADAVKFQAHIARFESHPSEPWRVHFSRQDATRYDYWKRMEFTEGQWRGLYEHARERGLLFVVSPFSLEAVDLLRATGIDMWKIASGETDNVQLIKHACADGRPVVVSTGMSTWQEIDAAISILSQAAVEATVLQCTTAYPCPPHRLGLEVMHQLRERYGVQVGLSDHSGETYAGLAAATLGASMIEVHVTFHKKSFGPDVSSSLDLAQLSDLIRGTAFIRQALLAAVSKDAVSRDLYRERQLFSRSIVFRHDMRAGAVLSESDVIMKKPGTGIPPRRLSELVGRSLRRDVEADTQVSEEDLEANA